MAIYEGSTELNWNATTVWQPCPGGSTTRRRTLSANCAFSEMGHVGSSFICSTCKVLHLQSASDVPRDPRGENGDEWLVQPHPASSPIPLGALRGWMLGGEVGGAPASPPCGWCFVEASSVQVTKGCSRHVSSAARSRRSWISVPTASLSPASQNGTLEIRPSLERIVDLVSLVSSCVSLCNQTLERRCTICFFSAVLPPARSQGNEFGSIVSPERPTQSGRSEIWTHLSLLVCLCNQTLDLPCMICFFYAVPPPARSLWSEFGSTVSPER